MSSTGDKAKIMIIIMHRLVLSFLFSASLLAAEPVRLRHPLLRSRAREDSRRDVPRGGEHLRARM